MSIQYLKDKLKPSITKRIKRFRPNSSTVLNPMKKMSSRFNHFPSSIHNPRRLLKEKKNLFLVKFNGHQMVMKIYPSINNNEVAKYFNELHIMRLKHPNIQPIIFNGSFRPTRNPTSHYFYTLTPYHKNGSLLDMLIKGVRLSESIVRTLFFKISDAVKLIHNNGFAHMDLSLSKILIDSQFSPKIFNFGMVCREGEEDFYSSGTRSYRAPEIINGTVISHQKADMYSLGVILYAMSTGNSLPFDENSSEFEELRIAFDRNPNVFFQKRFKITKKIWSEDFKEIFSGMVHKNPNQRWDWEQINYCKWTEHQILNNLELSQSMAQLIKDLE